jgi:hypothetical protein
MGKFIKKPLLSQRHGNPIDPFQMGSPPRQNTPAGRMAIPLDNVLNSVLFVVAVVLFVVNVIFIILMASFRV